MANKVYLFQNTYTDYSGINYADISSSDYVGGRTYYAEYSDTPGNIIGQATASTYEPSYTLTLGWVNLDFSEGYIRSIYEDMSGYVSVYYYANDGDSNDNNNSESNVSVTISLDPITGIATWSFLTSNSDIQLSEPYIQLWGISNYATDEFQIAANSYDFSEYMSVGEQYYVTIKADYYNEGTSQDYGTVTGQSETITYSSKFEDPDLPDWPKSNSFKDTMTAIADAVRYVKNIGKNLSLVEMIENYNTILPKKKSDYVKTDFDSCVSYFASCIRYKNDLINTPLKLSQFPEYILKAKQKNFLIKDATIKSNGFLYDNSDVDYDGDTGIELKAGYKYYLEVTYEDTKTTSGYCGYYYGEIEGTYVTNVGYLSLSCNGTNLSYSSYYGKVIISSNLVGSKVSLYYIPIESVALPYADVWYDDGKIYVSKRDISLYAGVTVDLYSANDGLSYIGGYTIEQFSEEGIGSISTDYLYYGNYLLHARINGTGKYINSQYQLVEDYDYSNVPIKSSFSIY